MERFTAYLSEFNTLSENELNKIIKQADLINYPKNDFFLKAGQVSQKIGFILSGILRVFFYDKDGNEISKYFIGKNNFAVNLQSFQEQTVSSEYYQAITETEVLIIPKSPFLSLTTEIKGFASIMEQVKEKALMEKISRRASLVHQDATTRYLDFIKKHGQMAYEIPLGQIASFLGIAQQSLSRIRKNLIKERI